MALQRRLGLLSEHGARHDPGDHHHPCCCRRTLAHKRRRTLAHKPDGWIPHRRRRRTRRLSWWRRDFRLERRWRRELRLRLARWPYGRLGGQRILRPDAPADMARADHAAVPPRNSSIAFTRNAGRSSGLRLVTEPLSTTTSRSTRQNGDAFSAEFLSHGPDLLRRHCGIRPPVFASIWTCFICPFWVAVAV